MNVPLNNVVAGTGGWISMFQNFSASNESDGGTIADGTYFPTIGNWRMEETQLLSVFGAAGMRGYITRRVVAYDWKAVIDLQYELGHSLGYLAQGDYFSACLFLGDAGNDNSLYPSNVEQMNYWAPWAVCEKVITIDNSDTGDIIRQQVQIAGCWSIYLMPADEDYWTDDWDFVQTNQLLGQ